MKACQSATLCLQQHLSDPSHPPKARQLLHRFLIRPGRVADTLPNAAPGRRAHAHTLPPPYRQTHPTKQTHLPLLSLPLSSFDPTLASAHFLQSGKKKSFFREPRPLLAVLPILHLLAGPNLLSECDCNLGQRITPNGKFSANRRALKGGKILTNVSHETDQPTGWGHGVCAGA